MRNLYKSIFAVLPILCLLFFNNKVKAQLTMNASVTQDVTCFDGGDGAITLNITSGTPPYSIEFFLFDGSSEIPIATISGTTDTNIVLNNAISTSDGSISYSAPFPAFGIKANDNPSLVGLLGLTTYRVRATSAPADAPFRTRLVTNLEITEPPELIASTVTVLDDCDNLGSGAIDISVSGGTPPYNFNWSNGETTEDVSALAAGTYSVDILDANSCPITLSGIIVESGPNAGMFNGTAGEVCTTDPPFNLFTLLDGSQDAGGVWTQLTGSTTLTGIGAGTVDFNGAASGLYNFRYTVSVPSCPDDFEDVSVNVTAAPIAEAGDDIGICAGDDLNLSTSGTVAATNEQSVAWATSGDGSFSSTIAETPIYTPGTSDISTGTVTLTLTAFGVGACGDDVDNMTLTITPAPTVDAGSDEEICSDESFVISTAATPANATNFASVAWNTSGSGSFTDATLIATTYNPSPADITAGSVTLTLTAVGNGSCPTINDAMSLTITLAPEAEAGNPFGICEGDDADLASTGTVSVANATTILWTTAGDGTFSDDAIETPIYTPGTTDISNGSVVLTLTATGNGSCDPAIDNVLITITPAPTADAGSGETICEGVAFDLTTAATPATASNFSSLAWTSTGSGAFSNASSLSTTYTPSAADATTGSVTLTLTANGNGTCSPVSSNVLYNIVTGPQSDAGSDEEICDTEIFDMTTFATTPAVANNTGLMWSTSGTGTFADATLLVTTYTPSAADISAGSVTLTLTAFANANCVDATDNMVLTITSSPIADAGDDATVCEGTIFDLASTGSVSATNAASVAWTTSGDGTFDDDAILLPEYTPGVADITAGAVTLTLTAMGNASCGTDADVCY